jgi:cell division transport system permease protein
MLSRQIRWAFRSILRTPGRSLSAIVVMSVTIFLVSATLLLGMAGTSFGETAKKRFTIPVQLTADADETSANNLATMLEELDEVKSVTVNSPEVVMDDLGNYLGLTSDEIITSIGFNPLQWELVVTPENPEQIKELTEIIEQYTIVEKAVFEEEVINKFIALFSLFRWIALGLAILALMVTTIVISSTIILSIASRRDEIEIMSLVGAPPSVIIMPYIIEGLFYGLIGGGLATVGIWFGWNKFQTLIQSMLPWFNISLPETTFNLILIATMTFGLLAGLLTSWRSSSVHIRRIKP